MKLEHYMDAVEGITPPAELNANIYEACVNGTGKKKMPSRKLKMRAACLCAAALVLAVGIPVLTTNPQTGENTVAFAGLTVDVRADGVEKSSVLEGAKVLSAIGTELFYQEMEIDGEMKKVYSGCSSTSFRITGDNIDHLVYESESQKLFCEYMSQHFPNGDETYVWTSYSFSFETEEFTQAVADPENPTKEELVALLEKKRQDYRNGITDEYHEMERFEEQTGVKDIDFSTLNISGEILYKGESSVAWVGVSNPDNEPQPTADGPVITTKPGEYVDWLFSRETSKYLSETPREEVDYTKLGDNVKITAYMKDGTEQVINLKITFNEEGQSTATFVVEMPAEG